MRLILTEYVNSLKEDSELDVLIQDLLRAYQIEIFTKPERGRQYGVDIYAVGKDFEDNNKKKVFLVTVKQGDLDRRNWNTEQNSIQQSLDEIITVFIRNNLAPQHKNLPVKIIVAYNGLMKQSIQQNWRGYVEKYPEYEFTLWGIDFLVNQFQDKLLNEQAFTNEIRSLVRKTIIHLENPEYDLSDLSKLLHNLFEDFQLTNGKRLRLKKLKQIRLIISIVAKYSEEADNLKHAVKASEKYLLQLWSNLSKLESDKDYISQIIAAFHLHISIKEKYISKVGYISLIEDGYSKNSINSLTYTYVIYEQVGILAMYGLELLQIFDLLSSSVNDGVRMASAYYRQKAFEVSNLIMSAINNNSIIFSPRADNHHIEINLIFILLQKLDRQSDISNLLQAFYEQMAQELMYSNIFPVFNNNIRLIAELEVDTNKRQNHQYGSSNLLTVLIEWAVVISNSTLYNRFRQMKEKLLPNLDLLLWFPDRETEEFLYTQDATNPSGYALSGIQLSENIDEFRKITVDEHLSNNHYKELSFVTLPFWSIGLIASRHYRTYTMPFYWRQFIN